MKGKAKTSAILIMAIVFLASVIFFPQSALSDPKDPREPLTETTCTSCSDCSAKLNGSYDIVTLVQDIIDHAGNCIIFGADNMTFDGGGHLIDSDTITFGAGILMSGKSGNTVQNCRIEDFAEEDSVAVYITSSSNNNRIINNVIRTNRKGVRVRYSSGNAFENNTIRNNVKGAEFQSSYDNLMYHNNFISNGVQASDDGTNTWYNDYPGGGNYWNDYTSCSDTLGGPNQDMPWSDWICDTNYTNGNIVDIYPWTEQDLDEKMPILYAPDHVYAGVNNSAWIEMQARDPTNDPLTFYVNDPNFIETDPGVFVWETEEGDEGEYQVIAWVSDGTYNATKMINVTVMDGFSVHHVMPYFETEAYSSAATANMIINYLGNDSVDQTDIYNYGIQYNLPENPTGELDPMGMDAALGHFDPYDVLLHQYDQYDNRSDGNPYEGYNFGVRAHTNSIEDYMRDIAHWMDYQVHLYSGSPEYADPDRVPPAVPIYGDTSGYGNWVVVNGFASDIDPIPPGSPYNPDFTVYGFWLTDPNTDGLGINRYVTAGEAESTYFKPISSTDQYNGKFVQVAEPPPELSDAQVTIARLETKQENTKLVNSLKTEDVPENNKPHSKIMNEQKEPEIVWEEIIPEFLLEDELFAEAFRGSEQGKQILINNPSDDRDYYIITFEKMGLTSAAIIIDAESGIFREGAWAETPENYVFISEEKAVNNVLRYLKSEKIRIQRQDKNRITSEFIWNPGELTSSPFQPYWKIVVKEMTFYVKNDGTVIHIPSLTL